MDICRWYTIDEDDRPAWQHSTIIAWQVPVRKWYDVNGEQTVVDAILDRLVHQSDRLELNGESLHKKQKRTNR